jgi:hypothetical protein
MLGQSRRPTPSRTFVFGSLDVSRAGGGHRFDPCDLHHPVLGFGPSPAISQFVRGNRGFLASGASLNPSLLAVGPAFACLSLRRKFPFPAQAETGSMTGWWVPSLSPTGPTIQSPQTARFPHDVK